LPGFTVASNRSTIAAHSRAASVLRGAFSRREMVGCDASGSPISGQRPTAIFVSGSCLPLVTFDGLVGAQQSRLHSL
jgi:hypothetical protein